MTPDHGRRLRLALAAVWLLDAALQYQPFMFTRAFGQSLAVSAQGNPHVIAAPITWSAGIIEQHPAVTNAAFATIQLIIALGIAWRPAVKFALAASVAWSVAVWWLGEGLGGILTGSASPWTGAPGAVIIYALLAMLLWPGGRNAPASFVAGRPFGGLPARLAVADPVGQHGVPYPADREHGFARSAGFGVPCARVRPRRHWHLPARAVCARRGDPGRGRGDGCLGHRRELRRHVHRLSHRPQFRPAARPARRRLLARAPGLLRRPPERDRRLADGRNCGGPAKQARHDGTAARRVTGCRLVRLVRPCWPAVLAAIAADEVSAVMSHPFTRCISGVAAVTPEQVAGTGRITPNRACRCGHCPETGPTWSRGDAAITPERAGCGVVAMRPLPRFGFSGNAVMGW